VGRGGGREGRVDSAAVAADGDTGLGRWWEHEAGVYVLPCQLAVLGGGGGGCGGGGGGGGGCAFFLLLFHGGRKEEHVFFLPPALLPFLSVLPLVLVALAFVGDNGTRRIEGRDSCVRGGRGGEGV